MSDYLVNLSRKGWFRGTVRGLNLPIPLPATLVRASSPWAEQPLHHRSYRCEGEHLEVILTGLGASLANEDERTDLAVFDARGLKNIQDLENLHKFFAPLMKRLESSGRLIVVGTSPEECGDTASQAAAGALAGFVRSCAKELGKGGVTANLISCKEAPDLAPALAFLGSHRSAFITGQIIELKGNGIVSHAWTKGLEGKRAFITGAARGIGLVTAKRFIEEGAQVLMVDLDDKEGLLEKEAERLGAKALALDITSESASAQITEALHGTIDLAVHNAGMTRDRTLAKMSAENWRLALDVNLGAVERLIGTLPIEQNGRIVVLSSVAGLAGNFGQTNYAAAKSGLASLVQCHAPQLDAQNITLNAIAPGFIETRLTAAIPFATREGGRRLSALGQGGRPLDVAEAITFLCLPAAQQITGQTMRVCGGSYLGA